MSMMKTTREDMLIKAEKLAGKDRKLLKLSLGMGSVLVGYSLGIEYEEDENENDYNVLAFRCPDLGHIYWFKDEEIVNVELADA